MSDNDNNGNDLLSDEIKEQIKSDEGFRTIVVMELRSIKSIIKNHTTDIDMLKSWKDKMSGIWWAIIGIGAVLTIFGVKLFIKS